MPEPDELDVETAISTIDKAMSYTQPLLRRTEGLTWLLFGLASALFMFSYAWVSEKGLDPHYNLLLLFLVGYAFLSIGPALLTWRIASVMSDAYRLDARRVGATIAILALLLVASNVALWMTLEDTQLNIAMSIVIFGAAPWTGLALAQWSRLSERGRRDTWILGATMAATGFALVYVFRAGATTIDLDMAIFAVTNGAIPAAAGLWRLVRA